MVLRLRLAGPSDRPLYRRIEDALRATIERGEARPGDRLPSVADLARDLEVNKLTVLKAFRALEAEGLLTSHVGRGTFVGRAPAAAEPAPSREPASGRALRRVREGYARDLRDLLGAERLPGTIDLTGGVPSPESVPAGLLERLTTQVLARDPRRLYAYGPPAGLPELRDAIARTLGRGGLDVRPEEVVVTNGSQQAIALIAAWAREAGRQVLCETPTFTGVPAAFMLFDHAVASVPWQEEGLDPAALARAEGGRPSILYACPDFQNPTGRTMTEAARRDLAAWARSSDTVVVEDAIFRDMRFEGDAPPALHGLLARDRRFLVGSVSKSFMTGLRVGFLVADPPLVAAILAYKRSLDLGGPSLVQAIAAAFLDDGYERHVERLRALYRDRRDATLAALARHMPEGVVWTRPQGGFQLWVTLPEGLSSLALHRLALARGVAIQPGPAHDVDGRFASSFRLGYGQATPEQIGDAVERLGAAVRALEREGARAAPGPGIPV
jgi:DNA-binding transcriptional MocR family regulator